MASQSAHAVAIFKLPINRRIIFVNQLNIGTQRQTAEELMVRKNSRSSSLCACNLVEELKLCRPTSLDRQVWTDQFVLLCISA